MLEVHYNYVFKGAVSENLSKFRHWELEYKNYNCLKHEKMYKQRRNYKRRHGWTNSKHLWFLKTCWPNSFSKFFIVVVDNISNWQFTVFPDERIVIKITGFESCFDGF